MESTATDGNGLANWRFDDILRLRATSTPDGLPDVVRSSKPGTEQNLKVLHGVKATFRRKTGAYLADRTHCGTLHLESMKRKDVQSSVRTHMHLHRKTLKLNISPRTRGAYLVALVFFCVSESK